MWKRTRPRSNVRPDIRRIVRNHSCRRVKRTGVPAGGVVSQCADRYATPDPALCACILWRKPTAHDLGR